MTNNTTRRHFLAVGTFAAVSASLGAAIAAEGIHPDLEIFNLAKEANATLASLEGLNDEDEAANSAACARHDELLERLVMSKPKTVRGIRAVLECILPECRYTILPDHWTPALLENLLSSPVLLNIA